MKAVRYTIFIVLIFIGVVFLGAPPLIGLWVKGQYTQIIRSFNRMNPNLTATISQYHFGWFHSDITTEFNVNFTAKLASENPSVVRSYRFLTYSNIAQGPAIFFYKGPHTRMTVALADVTLNIPSFHITGHSLWRLKKSIDWRFSSPGFQVKVDHTSMTMKSMQGTAMLDLRSRRLQVRAGIAAAQLSFGGRRLGFHHLQYLADIQKIGLINYGMQSLLIDRFALRWGPGSLVKMHGFSATTNSTVRDGQVSVFNHVRLKKISNNALALRGLNLDFSVGGIAQDRLNRLFGVLSSQNEQNKLDLPAISQASMALWQAGFNLQLHSFLLNTSQGPVVLKGILTMPAQPPTAGFLKMLFATQADFSFKAPKHWLLRRVASFMKRPAHQPVSKQPVETPKKIAQRKIQAWLKQKLLVSSGRYYKMRIQHQQDVLLVNGQPPALLAPLLQKKAP
jgi:uncharacterized protein YdgA (DUF945 family)